MTSYQDIMIVCSDLPAGKPLHMCIGTAMVHLHICQHPCQNPKCYKSSEPLHLFLNPFSMPVTYILQDVYIKLSGYGHGGPISCMGVGHTPCQLISDVVIL